MSETGFIILRHVRDDRTNLYWIECYRCIRKFYPECKIIIVDDNSDYRFITEIELYKTRIIQSEYAARGELLPYYYYLQNKDFDRAVILHDSVFVNRTLDLNVEKYKILWGFTHHWDQIEDETKMILALNDPELTKFYTNKQLWTGCFGCMSIITHDYLTFINSKHDISKLLDFVKTRYNRCSLERVLACLLQMHESNRPLFGDIHKYCIGKLPFEQRHYYRHLPFIKVWTGR